MPTGTAHADVTTRCAPQRRQGRQRRCSNLLPVCSASSRLLVVMILITLFLLLQNAAVASVNADGVGCSSMSIHSNRTYDIFPSSENCSDDAGNFLLTFSNVDPANSMMENISLRVSQFQHRIPRVVISSKQVRHVSITFAKIMITADPTSPDGAAAVSARDLMEAVNFSISVEHCVWTITSPTVVNLASISFGGAHKHAVLQGFLFRIWNSTIDFTSSANNTDTVSIINLGIHGTARHVQLLVEHSNITVNARLPLASTTAAAPMHVVPVGLVCMMRLDVGSSNISESTFSFFDSTFVHHHKELVPPVPSPYASIGVRERIAAVVYMDCPLDHPVLLQHVTWTVRRCTLSALATQQVAFVIAPQIHQWAYVAVAVAQSTFTMRAEPFVTVGPGNSKRTAAVFLFEPSVGITHMTLYLVDTHVTCSMPSGGSGSDPEEELIASVCQLVSLKNNISSLSVTMENASVVGNFDNGTAHTLKYDFPFFALTMQYLSVALLSFEQPSILHDASMNIIGCNATATQLRTFVPTDASVQGVVAAAIGAVQAPLRYGSNISIRIQRCTFRSVPLIVGNPADPSPVAADKRSVGWGGLSFTFLAAVLLSTPFTVLQDDPLVLMWLNKKGFNVGNATNISVFLADCVSDLIGESPPRPTPATVVNTGVILSPSLCTHCMISIERCGATYANSNNTSSSASLAKIDEGATSEPRIVRLSTTATFVEHIARRWSSTSFAGFQFVFCLMGCSLSNSSITMRGGGGGSAQSRNDGYFIGGASFCTLLGPSSFGGTLENCTFTAVNLVLLQPGGVGDDEASRAAFVSQRLALPWATGGAMTTAVPQLAVKGTSTFTIANVTFVLIQQPSSSSSRRFTLFSSSGFLFLFPQQQQAAPPTMAPQASAQDSSSSSAIVRLGCNLLASVVLDNSNDATRKRVDWLLEAFDSATYFGLSRPMLLDHRVVLTELLQQDLPSVVVDGGSGRTHAVLFDASNASAIAAFFQSSSSSVGAAATSWAPFTIYCDTSIIPTFTRARVRTATVTRLELPRATEMPLEATAAATNVVVSVVSAAGVVGAAAASSLSATVDAQLLILVGQSTCAPPELRSATGAAQFLVSPFYSFGDIGIVLGNVALVVFVVVVHTVVVRTAEKRALQQPEVSITAMLSVGEAHRQQNANGNVSSGFHGTALHRDATSSGKPPPLAPPAVPPPPAVRLQYPNHSYSAAVLLLPGVLNSAVSLAFQFGTGSSGAVGIFGLVAVLCAIGVRWKLLCSVRARRLRFQRYRLSVVNAFIAPWALPLGRWGPMQVRATHGRLVGAVRGGAERYAVYPLVISWIVCIVTGLPVPQSWCVAVWVSLCTVPVCSIVFIAWCRPGRARLSDVLHGGSFVAMLGMHVSGCVMAFSSDGSGAAALLAFAVCGSLATALRTVHTVVVFLWERQQTASASEECSPPSRGPMEPSSPIMSISAGHHLCHHHSRRLTKPSLVPPEDDPFSIFLLRPAGLSSERCRSGSTIRGAAAPSRRGGSEMILSTLEQQKALQQIIEICCSERRMQRELQTEDTWGLF